MKQHGDDFCVATMMIVCHEAREMGGKVKV